MQILLFAGAPNVGKSKSIYNITQLLLANGYVDVLNAVPPTYGPVRAILEGTDSKGKKVRVAINDATDDAETINGFAAFCEANGLYDFLICSVRDNYGNTATMLYNSLGITQENDNVFEIPLARITRRKHHTAPTIAWYQERVDKLAQHILSLPPFELLKGPYSNEPAPKSTLATTDMLKLK